MSEWLKLGLFIALAGAAVTLGVAVWARLMTEERRLARAFRQGLGATPDASLVGRGTGRGVALSLTQRQLVTAWDRGAWRMTYPLDDLLGVELDLDGHVAARAMRGEPRRMLDRQSGAEQEVSLRFLFDDARHPDFELTLWPAGSGRGAPKRPREAIAEGNRWIARVETLLRRSGGALVLTPAPAAVKKPAPPVAAPPTAPNLEDEEDDPPPWDEDEAEFAD